MRILPSASKDMCVLSPYMEHDFWRVLQNWARGPTNKPPLPAYFCICSPKAWRFPSIPSLPLRNGRCGVRCRKAKKSVPRSESCETPKDKPMKLPRVSLAMALWMGMLWFHGGDVHVHNKDIGFWFDMLGKYTRYTLQSFVTVSDDYRWPMLFYDLPS